MAYQLKNKPEASAYSYGLRLLSFHGYSEAALIQKLQRAYYEATEIQLAIKKLKNYGFINDQNLAMSYFQKYFSSGKTGFYLIRAKLQQKGFPPEIIAECLSTYDQDVALQQAVKLVQVHFSDTQLQDKPKLARYLAARGFSSDIIQSVFEKLYCE
jgi:regulatory protein